MIEQNSLSLKRESLVVSGRNLQRTILGDLSPKRKYGEKLVMDNLLAHERSLFYQMELTDKQLGEIRVNPDLTTFLDGSDGLGGYADVYSQKEYMAPGTKLEMDLEKRIIKQHLLLTLTPNYLRTLRTTGKPLVIVEGGAGPDLRTFETVCHVLSERKANLRGVPIKLVITDISKRMAAITASKMRTSTLVDQELDVETAVLATDVFELLEKLPNNSLTYALLPFGVLSFGLDGNNPQQILETVSGKLINGGGMLATVYHSGWVNYSEQLKELIQNLGNLNIKELAPFVIDIRNGKMQVADGLAFNCRTFHPEELAKIIQNARLKIDGSICTPAGWAYWPKNLLAKVVEGRIYPEGCPQIPPPSLMDLAKKIVLDLVTQNEEGNTGLSRQLFSLIPDCDQICDYPTPYITMTAKKPVTS